MTGGSLLMHFVPLCRFISFLLLSKIIFKTASDPEEGAGRQVLSFAIGEMQIKIPF
jgi:hypothetical protein